MPKVAKAEVAKLVNLNQRSFDGIISLYGDHFEYLTIKTIWVVEPHVGSNDKKSIARFLRKLGFEQAESVKSGTLTGQSGKPDMILLKKEKSIARFLRKLGFKQAESVKPGTLTGQSGKPDMILLNNEEETLQTDVKDWAKQFVEQRDDLDPKIILFWYDTNGIRFPPEIEKSNFANSRYTLYNNIIESFRVQDIEQ